MKAKSILIPFLCGVTCLCSAQTTDSSNYCKADFDYYLDTRIMTFAPAAPIQFKDKSTGNPVSWVWLFSNSSDTFSTEQNPLHIFNYKIYSGPGLNANTGVLVPAFIPQVTLKIRTSSGCVSSISKPVYFQKDTASPPVNGCFVYFKAFRKDTLSLIPESVAYMFIPEASKNVIKWHWDFGDSTTSEEYNPIHIYSFQPAVYNVSVKILTSDSCTNSYSSYVYVGSNDTSIVPSCNASFSYKKADYDPKYWLFQDNSTGNPTAWFWDFGDGTYSNEQTPPAHFFRRDTIPDTLGYLHIVHSSGVFRVCLTTLSGNSCKSMFCDNVNVNFPIDSSFVNPCGYLINLVSSNILGSENCKAKASASLIDSLGNSVPVSSYFWSNGSTGQSGENLCPNIPYYLVITSESGCQTAGSFAIMDYTAPYNLYGYWTVNGSGSLYNFNYTPPDNSYTCNWVFDDSTVITGDKAVHNFASPDSNNYVIVIVKDSNGNPVYSERINLGQNAASGLKNPKTAGLKVYPNPVQDELKVSMPSELSGVIKIEIFDALGRSVSKEQIYASGSTELKLNTNELTTGFYIISISANGNKLGTAKFMK